MGFHHILKQRKHLIVLFVLGVPFEHDIVKHNIWVINLIKQAASMSQELQLSRMRNEFGSYIAAVMKTMNNELSLNLEEVIGILT